MIQSVVAGHTPIAFSSLPPASAHIQAGRLRALGASNWLHATLEVKAPARDGFGMNGSGMFIINPPWTLEKKLHETLPRLTELLAQGEGAKYTLESEST